MSAIHRVRGALSATVLGLAMAASSPTHSQNNPGGNMGDNSGLNGSLSRADLEKLSGDHKQDSNRKDPATTPARAKEEGAKLAAALQLACDVNDARLVVAGTRRGSSGGKPLDTRVYEVACTGSVGYLFETQGTAMPVAISCLSAEEARAADEAKGREPGFFCALPGNKDAHALVTSLIAADTGAQCAVARLEPFGRSESTKSEYSEIVCKDGKGFLLRTPLPGSETKTTAMSCADAARQGIKCRLTDAGPVEAPVTLDTLKSALAQHGETCRIDQLRMIGQEDHQKRYVVEYLCADQPAGRVAFIPLEGNTNPFEALECSAAALEGLACTLAPAK
jgi:hypothetical protein